MAPGPDVSQFEPEEPEAPPVPSSDFMGKQALERLLAPQDQAPQEDYYADPENYLKQLMDAEKGRQAQGMSTQEQLAILLSGIAHGFGAGPDPYQRLA